MARRPERQAPPEVYYDAKEARKYTSGSRSAEIQARLAKRAIELLALPEEDDTPRLLLDIGCGSGLSGETISENGHQWIGVDISESMLDVAIERETDGDLLLGDIGQGLGMRSGVFDGAISISAVQWLCNADKTSHEPRKRLKCFFQSLYNCLARGARAVLQFYPENEAQLELINSSAMRCGFSGGLVVDFPHSTRAKKYYLCLISGPPSAKTALPKAKEGSESEAEGDSDGEDAGESQVAFAGRERPSKRAKVDKDSSKIKDRAWVLKKKEQRRKAGHHVPMDTKYTGRKRKARF